MDPQQNTGFFDVDTQVDFMLPEGKLYVPGAETLIPNFEAICSIATERNILMFSTVDAHAPDDPEFKDFPPHCVKGTDGQKKIPQTLLDNNQIVPPTAGAEPQPAARQFIFEKQTTGVFDNPNIPLFLRHFAITRVFVFGVATEYCVRAAALELLKRRFQVFLIKDAIRGITPEAEANALKEMEKEGAQLITTEQLAQLVK